MVIILPSELLGKIIEAKKKPKAKPGIIKINDKIVRIMKDKGETLKKINKGRKTTK